MQRLKLRVNSALLLLSGLAATTAFAASRAPFRLDWTTVVNNGDVIPGTSPPRTFNSYNEPSVSANGLVVFRGRSRGGGEMGMATHGIYTRDMAARDSGIVRILDRAAPVPYPNNLNATFKETPSFPRIDRWEDTIVTRGNHQPVWSYTPAGATEATRAGTSGVYVNPHGKMLTGAAKLGVVPGFQSFLVPGLAQPTFFDVFPGAPGVTNGATIVFKGNYTVGTTGKTGVFFRQLEDLPAGGSNPVQSIANTSNTKIPGTDRTFGSVSPPSADGDLLVFAGFDDEQSPSLGGIYLAPLIPSPPLASLVSVGSRVPEEGREARFTRFGEGLSFDGLNVGFWGAWGQKTRTVRLYCPEEGSMARIAYCNHSGQFADDPVSGEIRGDRNSVCDDTSDHTTRCYQEVQVPVDQGIFIHNIKSGRTTPVAKAGADFYDFLFWNYSGKVPGMEEGSDEGDDGEPIRWRSSAFVAVSGPGNPPFNTVFKATRKDAVRGEIMGIYLGWEGGRKALTILDTTMAGQEVDPMAEPDSMITEVGLEREGFRNRWLAITARMAVEGGGEDDGMAGIYLLRLPADLAAMSGDRGTRPFHTPDTSGWAKAQALR